MLSMPPHVIPYFFLHPLCCLRCHSAAYTGGVSAEECEVDNSEACGEYHAKLNELAASVGSNRIANLPQEIEKPEKERVMALVQEP